MDQKTFFYTQFGSVFDFWIGPKNFALYNCYNIHKDFLSLFDIGGGGGKKPFELLYFFLRESFKN